MTLINVVTLFFVICPLVFYLPAQFGVPLAMIYFVWIGILSLMMVAQPSIPHRVEQAVSRGLRRGDFE